jgi:hypothetical protein
VTVLSTFPLTLEKHTSSLQASSEAVLDRLVIVSRQHQIVYDLEVEAWDMAFREGTEVGGFEEEGLVLPQPETYLADLRGLVSFARRISIHSPMVEHRCL